MTTPERMRKALRVVDAASSRFVAREVFEQGVLNRLRAWVSNLPRDDHDFVAAVVGKAAARDTGTGADVNGVALDAEGMASLESLVLHYAEQDSVLFAGLEELLGAIQIKLEPHRGPRYQGPWP